MMKTITWPCGANVTVFSCSSTPRNSPPAPSHQSSGATPGEPPHWSRPGRLWSAPPPRAWTSSLSAGWEKEGLGFTVCSPSIISPGGSSRSLLSLTWCTPPCCPRWPARSPRRPSAGEWKLSQGSPCPVQSTAPRHTPPGCSPWTHKCSLSLSKLCSRSSRTQTMLSIKNNNVVKNTEWTNYTV